MSTSLTQPTLLHSILLMEVERRVKSTVWIQESVVVGQDGSRGKFGWSEGDVLEIVKNGLSDDKAGKVHL